jgi:hypothetical protein
MGGWCQVALMPPMAAGMVARPGGGQAYNNNKYVWMEIGQDEDGNPVIESVHRLVLWCKELCLDENSRQKVAMHGNERGEPCKARGGVNVCVNPRHLSWQSQADNVADCRRQKRRLPH